MRFSALVLNYKNYRETIDCVNQLLIYETITKILIIDNDSQNNSFNILSEIYDKNNKVFLISTPKNLGYTGGFNYGLKKINKEHFDGIIISTSDTRLLKFNHIETHILSNSIIGPAILNDKGIPTSLPKFSVTINYILSIYLNFYVLLFFSKIKRFLFPFYNKKSFNNSDLKKFSSRSVYQVHGSWMILTKTFFKNFPNIPCPTFLFAEEDFLSYYCRIKGLTVLHYPKIIVEHKGQKSSIFKAKNPFNWRNKQQNIAQKMMRKNFSLKKLLSFLLEDLHVNKY